MSAPQSDEEPMEISETDNSSTDTGDNSDHADSIDSVTDVEDNNANAPIADDSDDDVELTSSQSLSTRTLRYMLRSSERNIPTSQLEDQTRSRPEQIAGQRGRRCQTRRQQRLQNIHTRNSSESQVSEIPACLAHWHLHGELV